MWAHVPPGKFNVQPVNRTRECAIVKEPAAIGGVARLDSSVGTLEVRAHACRSLLKVAQHRPAFDRDTGLAKALDQETLVLILLKDVCVRERTETNTHLTEDGARGPAAGYPQIHGENFSPTVNDRVGQTDLTIELQRPRLHRDRA